MRSTASPRFSRPSSPNLAELDQDQLADLLDRLIADRQTLQQLPRRHDLERTLVARRLRPAAGRVPRDCARARRGVGRRIRW